MSVALRVLLVVGSVLAFVYVLAKIRKCQLEVGDSVFWFIFAACLILVAVFPQIVIVPSHWIGFESPANFLFLLIICILVLKQFMMTIQIGALKSRLRAVAQKEALDEAEKDS